MVDQIQESLVDSDIKEPSNKGTLVEDYQDDDLVVLRMP